jgi:YfiH family protein
VDADPIIVPQWPAPANVRALVTTRQLPGNSQPPFDAFNLGLRSGEDPAVVRANRELLVRALALPSRPNWLRQVHGTCVAVIPPPLPAFGHLPPRAGEGNASIPRHYSVTGIGRPADERDVESISDPVHEPEADAAVACESGVVLAILTADCLPILLCADDGREIAALHAGWRGLSAGVIQACVSRMRTPPARLLAWLGPAIGPRSYEVGDEVRDAFIRPDENAAAAFEPNRPGHWLCDLYTLARLRLRAAGVTRIHGGGFDTFTDPRFYSYRRDGARSGRFASLIWITRTPETA